MQWQEPMRATGSHGRAESTTRDLDSGVRGLRIAWSPTLGYAQVASDVLETSEQAALTFHELGCEVEQADPNLPTR